MIRIIFFPKSNNSNIVDIDHFDESAVTGPIIQKLGPSNLEMSGTGNYMEYCDTNENTLPQDG